MALLKPKSKISRGYTIRAKQSLRGVILEQFLRPHITGQHIERLMPRLRRHSKNARASSGRARQNPLLNECPEY
jgi:hypothetical protein